MHFCFRSYGERTHREIRFKVIGFCFIILTAVMNVEMLDFYSHEDVVIQLWNVTIPDLEVLDEVFLPLE